MVAYAKLSLVGLVAVLLFLSVSGLTSAEAQERKVRLGETACQIERVGHLVPSAKISTVHQVAHEDYSGDVPTDVYQRFSCALPRGQYAVAAVVRVSFPNAFAGPSGWTQFEVAAKSGDAEIVPIRINASDIETGGIEFRSTSDLASNGVVGGQIDSTFCRVDPVEKGTCRILYDIEFRAR